jgi:deoxyribonucleoside regulator
MHDFRASAHPEKGAKMIDESHHELLAQIASMYYEHEKNQNEIAYQLGISRVKVYRLLKEARQEQVVEFTIHWPNERDAELEKNLVRFFNLREALVLKSSFQSDTTSLRRLGQMAARYLEMILQDGMILTVCLGRSTYEVIDAVRPSFRKQVDVAQAMGSLPFSTQELDNAALARQLALKLGGRVLYLPSPLMASSPEAARVLRSQPVIDRTLEASRCADVALLGIGSLKPGTSRYVQPDLIPAQNLAELVDQGAVGDIAGQFFNLSGHLHPCLYNECTIGLTLEELKRIPLKLAVAQGREKVKAILGALRAGVIDVLCTDSWTTNEVLRMNAGT